MSRPIDLASAPRVNARFGRAAAIDMSPPSVEARLAACSALSPLGLTPLPIVDMSPAAVEARLAEWAELTAFCLELATAAPASTSHPR